LSTLKTAASTFCANADLCSQQSSGSECSNCCSALL
jgi:hypothetical protein